MSGTEVKAEQLSFAIAVAEPTRRCSGCRLRFPLDRFYTSGKYLNSLCKPCANAACREYSVANREKRNARLRAWRRRNPEAARLKDRRQALRQKYGLTLDQAEGLKASNGGMCWICHVLPSRCIDHDHKTGAVRGALCCSCNTFLGRVEATPEILLRMRDYLDAATHADTMLQLAIVGA